MIDFCVNHAPLQVHDRSLDLLTCSPVTTIISFTFNAITNYDKSMYMKLSQYGMLYNPAHLKSYIIFNIYQNSKASFFKSQLSTAIRLPLSEGINQSSGLQMSWCLTPFDIKSRLLWRGYLSKNNRIDPYCLTNLGHMFWYIYSSTFNSPSVPWLSARVWSLFCKWLVYGLLVTFPLSEKFSESVNVN